MENKMENEQREYTDIYFIAALLAYGFEYSSMDDINPNRQKFLFLNQEKLVYVLGPDGISTQETEDLSSIKMLYSSRRLLFPPTYPDILRDLKQQIISKRSPNGQK